MILLRKRKRKKFQTGGMGNFDLGTRTRLLPEIEFHRREGERKRERERGIVSNCIPPFQPSSFLLSFLPSLLPFLLPLQALSNVCRSRRRF